MHELLHKNLSDWSKDEIDGFIVDAYLSLGASLKGQLHTTDGLVVALDMQEWGLDNEDGTCLACVAGAFFVSKVGTLMLEHPYPYGFGDTPSNTNVLTFMDGLRYLEEDTEDGESIRDFLHSMGYETQPAEEGGEYFSHLDEEKVASALKRFIDLNPRLTDRLRIATTKEGL